MGLLLGGGISFVSPLYGWSADSIKEMDVVLVTGQLVTVTATNTYSDLFRALKGGANRLGIVTRYEIYPAHTGTKDQKNWYGGVIVMSSFPGSMIFNVSFTDIILLSTLARPQWPSAMPPLATSATSPILKQVRT
jgi:hypothetical protein